jgi:hypothetical protein
LWSTCISSIHGCSGSCWWIQVKTCILVLNFSDGQPIQLN